MSFVHEVVQAEPAPISQTLMVTGSEFSIPVPAPASLQGPGTTYVQLLAGTKFLGDWSFPMVFKGPSPMLKLSLAALDQRFVTLEHPHSSPVADNHRQGTLPTSLDEIRLLVETRVNEKLVWQSAYHIRWNSPDAAERQLSAWRRTRTPPIEWFYVELTTFCNLTCPFCPSSTLQRPRVSMPLPLARKIFEEIGRYRYQHRQALGYAYFDPMVFLHVMGEPLIHPNLEKIVTIAKEQGITPALFTNATLLNQKNAKKILDAGVTHLTISFNVVDSVGYTHLGATGSFAEQKRRVVEFLHKRKERRAFSLHVDLQYITAQHLLVAGEGLLESRQQVWQLYRQWLSLARHLEADAGGSPWPTPPVDPGALADPLAPNTTRDTSLRLPLAAGITLIIKDGCSFGNAKLPDGLEVTPTPTGRCPFNNPSKVMCIFVDGSVSFCSLDYENTVALGNLQEKSIVEIWSGDRMNHIREDMNREILTESLCQRCLGQVTAVEKIKHEWNQSDE